MTWKDFLQKCNEAYSLGEVYVTTFDDVECIKRDTGIVLQELSPVSDKIYDQVYYQCKKLYPTDSFFQALTSINTGYGVDIDLPTPAGSLDECKLGDLARWIKRDKNYIVTEKLDGCSIILFYEQGCFRKAVTRGDGYKGKDCTRHVRKLVPPTVNTKFTGMIRGELICPKDEISLMLWELKEETGREYKNGRNTIAGFLNSKETLQSVLKHARVVVYSIMDSTEPQSEQYKFLDWWFTYTASKEVIKGSDITDEKMIDKVNYYHMHGKYETDGIVITLDEPGIIEYETNSINPKNARKFKVRDISTGMSNEIVEMTVVGCEWNPSKDGKLKPIVLFEPKQIDGITISKATGNNYEFLNKLNLHIGQKLLVIRAGSVIPKIIGEA